MATASANDATSGTPPLLTDVLSEPYELSMGTAKIGASVGIAETDDPGASPQELLRQADEFMYREKQTHPGRR